MKFYLYSGTQRVRTKREDRITGALTFRIDTAQGCINSGFGDDTLFSAH